MSNTPFMQQALELAKIRRGFCAPNPSVGAVIVRDNKVVATGYHHGAGSPHAEIEALANFDKNPQDAVMYVTLEPCNHYGRTPPCTQALIQSGIKHVVYGYRDPNALVKGHGEADLNAAGVHCTYEASEEIDMFYQSYSHWLNTKTPFITAKIAISLDGKIAGKAGKPLQITGEAAAEYTHYCRKNADAILTTAKTIISDNPQLNARYHNEVIPKKIYILDRQLTLPLKSKIFSTAASITIFHAKNAVSERKIQLEAQGAQCISIDEDHEGLNLKEIIQQIGSQGVHDLWIEAGGQCYSSFLKQSLLQRSLIYIAPKILGEGLNAFDKEFLFNQKVRWHQLGNDVVCDIIFL